MARVTSSRWEKTLFVGSGSLSRTHPSIAEIARSVGLRPLRRTSGSLLPLDTLQPYYAIHRSAWNTNSANFAFIEFSEVHLQDPGKNHVIPRPDALSPRASGGASRLQPRGGIRSVGITRGFLVPDWWAQSHPQRNVFSKVPAPHSGDSSRTARVCARFPRPLA